MRLIHGPDALASTDDATKDDVAKEECGLLGIVGEISHWEWTLTRADDPWKVVAALCAALVGVSLTLWLSRRERTSGYARAPLFGTSLRCATWILLALVTLGPARVRVEQHAILPIVSVLRDVSMSVDPALMKQAQITTLAGRADSSVHDFSRGVHPETSAEHQKSKRENSADDDATSPRSGKATDIALALRQTADLDHPAAIILLSDGRTTVGDDPLVVARELGERGVPIFAVGVGEATPRRGVRLVSVESRSQVWKDEPFVVEVSLESLSATQQSVSLRLSKISSGNEPGTEVARAQATLDRSKGRVRHEFRIQENVPGRYVYRVEVLDGAESLASSTTAATTASTATKPIVRESAPVTVVERDRLRVLVIAGEPTWDFRQVERWLVREPTLESTCWLQSADEGRRCTGTRPLDEPPASLEELVWYDVILLLDPDPDRFVGDWGTWLRQFVEGHKGGMLYQSGPRFSGAWRAGPLGESLAEVWPVELATAGELEAAQSLAPPVRGWPVHVPAAERGHSLLRDAGIFGESNENAWKVYWSSPVAGRKPLGRVLLEDANPETQSSRGARPLLAVGRFGAAHVAYLGCTGVWRGGSGNREGETVERWREAFWLRLTRYLSEGRVWEGHRRGWLEIDRPRVEVGERVEFVARLQDVGTGDASDIATAEGLVAIVRASKSSKPATTNDAVKPDEKPDELGAEIARLALARSEEGQGEFRATWTATQAGTFTIEVPLKDSRGMQVETLVAPLDVEAERSETSDPGLDESTLREIARLSGGQYFSVAQAGQVANALALQTEVRVTRSPPQSIWDHAGTLVALTGLLGGEWWLRKRHRKR